MAMTGPTTEPDELVVEAWPGAGLASEWRSSRGAEPHAQSASACLLGAATLDAGSR